MLVHKILKKVRRTGLFLLKKVEIFKKLKNFLNLENKLLVHFQKIRRTGFFLEKVLNFCKNSQLLTIIW